MLHVQHHGDVAVVIDRHAAAKVVCCCHKIKIKALVFPKREPQRLSENNLKARAVFA
jgi:hypothetical protein